MTRCNTRGAITHNVGTFVLIGGRGSLIIYVILCIHVPTHVSLQGGSVIDSVMIVKDKHGPEAWL